MTVEAIDIIVLSTASFFGNVGVSLTGFGMAILYIFVLQLASLLGYDNKDFKYCIFIQALALASVQPLLMWKSQPFNHASRKVLCYVLPPTIIFTPLGQLAGEKVSTHMVQAVSGVLVTVVSVYELHKNRKMICSLVKCSCFRTAPSPLSPSTAPEHAVLDVYEEHQLRELTVDENSFFNRYALHEQVLGKGAFSIVKKGSNLQTGEDVAIKVISKQTLLDNELEATRNEASILRNLSHSNIIQALDTFENVDYYFLVQELVSDGDLFSHIENNGSLGEKESQCICRSIIDALSYMHANKICHRDIKPENVLLKHDEKKKSSY